MADFIWARHRQFCHDAVYGIRTVINSSFFHVSWTVIIPSYFNQPFWPCEGEQRPAEEKTTAGVKSIPPTFLLDASFERAQAFGDGHGITDSMPQFIMPRSILCVSA